MKLTEIDSYIRNESERKLTERADALAVRFAERAARHDQEGSFPFDNFEDLKHAGFMTLTVPKEYGGEEISLYELVLLLERIGRGDGSTALSFGWHIGQVLHFRMTRKWPEPLFQQLCADIVASGVMINTFASEKASGSPSRGGKPETVAVKTEGGWLVTGRKTFSTLSPILDRFVASAYVTDEDRVDDFLVRVSDQVRIEETWNTLGMRATGSHDVVMERAFVPDEARISRYVGDIQDDGGGWLLHIPACYLGIAFAARDFAVNFARIYRPNSLPGPIAELTSVKHQIGLMEAELRIARNFVYSAAEKWDRQSDQRIAMKPDLGLAKYVATNSAIRVVDLAMRIVGGSCLSKDLPLERYYRDVRAGLHNPPMDDNVIQGLANSALQDIKS